MALLPNITYAPGEPMQDAFDKQNAAIDTINLMGGGTTGQLLSKSSNDDFDTVWVDAPVLKFVVVNIGDWDMNTNSSVTVATGLTTEQIRTIDVMIRRDDGNLMPFLLSPNATSDISGSFGVTSLPNNILLRRRNGGEFDSSNFNSTSFNRGFITIGYLA